ncbi:hypothetical protein A3C87_01825 [Candidatus Kaiserbacteria bacterium RIFCSPHIGHO2_02_FULL_49_34]|uniref:Uncharacterized protein n=1 Tax=Candidatus Kaiserbacteria bacterium RIFCSPHIGHO2_02_FULL_49_34 TaxID=1798491 RepID=A0A1F6DLU1_9BACT|nr:MAG: hypothetical protein A3C87_01825 [Candidatus Kaiserbacteria bacterium RIFCSPHIGHO2_02_FULL_49_34]
MNPSREDKKCFSAVGVAGVIVSLVATFHAAVGDYLVVAFYSEANWFHFSIAVCKTVAWVYVYMAAPKANRAVVRIAITCNKGAALRAGKVFFGTSELTHSLLYIVSTPIMQEKSPALSGDSSNCVMTPFRMR